MHYVVIRFVKGMENSNFMMIDFKSFKKWGIHKFIMSKDNFEVQDYSIGLVVLEIKVCGKL